MRNNNHSADGIICSVSVLCFKRGTRLRDCRNFSFEPDEPLLVDFLKLEKLYHNYEKMFKKYSRSSNAADVAALDELRDIIEQIEIELQCLSIQLR